MMLEKQHAAQVVAEVKKAVVGKDDIVVKALLAILARGHLLLEDIPGVGKTTLAIAFSKALGLKYNRVQFTPDVMPSDLTGFSLYNKATGQMEYQPGALLCNLFLADELNRATSRTQSALLEAMEEGQVTVDGIVHALPEPFMVIATQNPVEFLGTYPLPEAQVDRFLLKVVIGYPTKEDEKLIIRQNIAPQRNEIRPLLKPEEIIEAQRVCGKIYIDEKIERYIVDIVFATRFPSDYGLNDLTSIISFGASPRASISLAKAARSYAFLRGRGYVVPEDVRAVAHDVLRHRIGLTYEAEANNITADDIVSEILDKVEVP